MNEPAHRDKMIRAYEQKALAELVNDPKPVLPRTVSHDEDLRMYARLGIKFRGNRGLTLIEVRLPAGWTRHQVSDRWFEVRDRLGQPMIEASVKIAPHEVRSHMRLTPAARAVLRERWVALPRWRRWTASPADYGMS